MTTLVANSSVRQVALGRSVDRPAALLPATGTGAIFTVSGGGILLTSLVGRVAVVMPATTNTTSIGVTPTVGSAQNAGIASALTTASLAAGSLLSAPATIGSAMVSSAPGVPVAIGLPANGVYIAPGTITITTTGTAATGTVEWTMTYIPYDAGSAVAAA